jgi:succinoglycan biosynthesis protein ExoA
VTTSIPFVTVVMPIRNEASHIEQTLDAVLAQDYPQDRMEIIIADGMSSDLTKQIIQQKIEISPNQSIRLIDNPGEIVPTGLNAAIRQAKGEIIVRVDGHTVISSDYVRNCVNELERTGADNVGGRMSALGEGIFGQAVALATSTPFGIGDARFHYSEQEEWVDTVYMGAWRKDVFERIGLFDEELVRDQDDEFNCRLLKHGGRILLSPLIMSEYATRSNPTALWRQYFQYGLWKVRVLQKHPRQMRLRQFIPLVFVFVLLFSLILSLFFRLGIYMLIVIVGGYLFANLFATLITARRCSWKVGLRLPLVYATLHLSYGFGFLVGLLRFAGRWGDQQGRTPGYDARVDG